MPVITPADFPKTSSISNDLYFVAIQDPDGIAQNKLFLAQAGGGSGSGGHIIVNSANLAFPNRARLRFASSEFVLTDDLANDQTNVSISSNAFLSKATFDSNNNGIIDIQAGGTGVALLSTSIAGFFGTATSQGGVHYRCNFTGTASPQPTDDSGLGYRIGSRWLYNGNEWVCTSATPGAATWAQTTGAGGGGGSSLQIQVAGNDLPIRPRLNFLGSGLTQVYDDPVGDATVVAIEQGDMLTSVYDSNNNGIIDIQAGGTGMDLEAEPTGFVYNIAGFGTAVLRQNFTSTGIPNNASDEGEGYGPGSLWIDGPGNGVYINKLATIDNAEWLRLGRHFEIQNSAGTNQAFRPALQFASTASVQMSVTQSAGATIVSASTVVQPVNWQTNASGATLAIRDSHHGATIKLSGTHDVLLPSSATATIRDGFQANLLLVTDSSTISFLPEDGGATVNGRTNVLSQRWGMVHLSYELATNSWYVIGLLS